MFRLLERTLELKRAEEEALSDDEDNSWQDELTDPEEQAQEDYYEE